MSWLALLTIAFLQSALAQMNEPMQKISGKEQDRFLLRKVEIESSLCSNSTPNSVKALIVINDSGGVQSVMLLSPFHPELKAPITAALLRWQYFPIIKRGRVVWAQARVRTTIHCNSSR